jgi:hypothetical protein
VVKFAGQDLSVAEFMQELVRHGWEVGLHGSFHSFDDAAELKRQKEQLEQVLQRDIASIRQHYLHFDINKTPRAQVAAGFKYDSSFGSNRSIGFRNGLALPFYHYDLAADCPLSLLQIPLHIQDGALMDTTSGLDLNPSLAFLRARELIDKVEAVQGLITLLWHPLPCGERNFQEWFQVYEDLLSHISQKNAWVATVGEIGRWWEWRRQTSGVWRIDNEAHG